MTIIEHMQEHARIMCVYRSGVRSGDHERVCLNEAEYVHVYTQMPVCGQCASFINSLARARTPLYRSTTVMMEVWSGFLSTGVQLRRGKIIGPTSLFEAIAMEIHSESHGYEYNG